MSLYDITIHKCKTVNKGAKLQVYVLVTFLVSEVPRIVGVYSNRDAAQRKAIKLGLATHEYGIIKKSVKGSTILLDSDEECLALVHKTTVTKTKKVKQ